MATPPLSDELAREAVEAWQRYDGATRQAADSLGLRYESFRTRLKIGQRRGFHLSSGAQTAMRNAGLNGVETKGGWIHNWEDIDGKRYKTGTTRWTSPGITPEQWAEKVRAVFDDLPAAPAIVQSEKSAEGKIAFFPHTDVHIGAVVSEDRGGVAYDQQEAVRRLREGFAACNAAVPPSETAIILNNGDLTHANDDRDVTVKHQHRLKVEGTHRSNLMLSVSVTIWQIDAALERHGRVIYRANKGNHDPNTPDVLTIALKSYYRDSPRVTIDDSERALWCWQRGRVFLSAHHGDGIKPEMLALNLPGLFPDEFGASRFWYFITGHRHEETRRMVGSILWWQLPSVCALDPYAADMGYIDTSAMRAMQFCERGGLKDDYTTRF